MIVLSEAFPGRTPARRTGIRFGEPIHARQPTGHLDAISGHAAARLATGRTRAEEYANALVPLPEHLAVNGLMWSFLWQLYSAIEDWAAWADARAGDTAAPPPMGSRRYPAS